MKNLSLIFAMTLLTTMLMAQDKNPANRKVYFGEQHLHTVNSGDAFAFGTRNTPDDAYRFAKGETVVKTITGQKLKKSTPYDWIAITDHSEYLGMMPLLLEENSPLADSPIGKLLAEGKGEEAFFLLIQSLSINQPLSYLDDPTILSSIWEKQKAVAEQHYEPGKFTTFVGFEWTSQPNSQNLHHNVIFRDKGPDVIFTSFNSYKREDLWSYQEVQRMLGHDNISIPHNSNVSNSMMFMPTNSYGSKIDKNWAMRSNLNTPSVEIYQTKGSSETNPAMSPNDEFASFESKFRHLLGSGGVVSKNDNSFVRRGLIDGVGFQEMMGANPFKLGIVGGADSHNAMSSNEEFNYDGVHGNTDKTAQIRLTSPPTVAGEAPRDFGSAGATAVWADENTREGIFDALKRKESYGTSGPLIRLRIFGGWSFTEAIMKSDDWVRQGYKNGVPMGGDLPEKPESVSAPTFMISASKDPESGHLDRVQVVKGYYKNGYPWEKVYDVAWSGDRKPDAQTGKVPPVGNTVNIKTAKYTNTIGEAQLAAVWTDPDFDPSQHAVYYLRVIEIPTPRWSTYDAVAIGMDIPEGVPATLQERAWSSPIWYTPADNLVKKAKEYPGLNKRVR